MVHCSEFLSPTLVEYVAMDKAEPPFQSQPNSGPASTAPSGSADAKLALEERWKRLLHFLWVGATVIFLPLLGYFFQERNWSNDNAASKRQNDTKSAFQVEQDVSQFIDERWAATDLVEDALKPGVPETQLKHAKEKYYTNFELWQTHLTRWAGQIAFLIDRPFDLPIDDKRAEINKNMDCLSFTLKFTSIGGRKFSIDHRSASHILQIIDHCHDLAKQDLESIGDGRRSRQSATPEDTAQGANGANHALGRFHDRRAHIWWLNNVLRCTILRRATTIRESGDQPSWEQYIMPQATLKYAPEALADDLCIRDYMKDENYGMDSGKK
jgi:hypothetical protein